jgi:predicted membrane metal-binding protein
MKRALKWLLILLALGIAVLLVLFFSRDAILRHTAIANIREQTGLTAEIGTFHVGVREPVIQITDFKLQNPPGFGDAPMLVIKEVFVEYDLHALKQEKVLHVTRARFNLAELAIVKNAAGKTNLFELGLALPKEKSKKGRGLDEFKRRTGLDFAGVDELILTVGTAKFIDLKNPANNREQNFAIEDHPLHHVTNPTGVVALLALRSGDFFSKIFGTDVWDYWK